MKLDLTRMEIMLLAPAGVLLNMYYHGAIKIEANPEAGDSEEILQALTETMSKINVEMLGDCSHIHKLMDKIRYANLSSVS